jgi:hypothetical protein
MSDIPFHLTRMGHRFFEATVPALVTELQRLNENLERLVAAIEKPKLAIEPTKPAESP